MMTPRFYQSDAQAAVYAHLRTREDNPCVVLPTGCHAPGHPILMHDGRVKSVETVVVGDILMGPDSQPRRVLELRGGRAPMYRIVPRKGEPFIVNGGHVLSLACTNEGKNHPCNTRGGEIDNVAVDQWLGRSKSWRHLRKLRRVAVNFPPIQRPDLDPWALGALLGDGYLVGGVKFSKPDVEILDAVWAEMQRHGLHCRAIERGGAWHVSFAQAKACFARPNKVFQMLRDLGLAGCLSEDKFIPECYKRGSRADRMGVLAGLLDTDGSLSGSGYDFISKSRRLSDDVVFVARSLGLAAYCSECRKRCQTGFVGTYWRVCISGDCSIIPMRCTRKRAPERRQKKNPLVCGFGVEPVGEGDYHGFLLDGDHLYVDGSFTVHHNSGKTIVMAAICSDAVNRWGGRVAVVSHVKELLEQTVEKLMMMAPGTPVGIYSASLRRKELGYAVTVAGIQSIYERAAGLGAVDLIIVDEAHLIPLDGDGMYRQFIEDARTVNPRVRVIGLTATPYRMKGGLICGPNNPLNHVCYEVGVRELIDRGFLCPLRSKAGRARADLSGVHQRGGEFIAGELEKACDTDMLVESAVAEIIEETSARCSVLIFAAGVRHGEHIVATFERRGVECGWVDGDTPGLDRDRTIERFKRGELKYLANVNVLTTGFDAPGVDCVALLRPTMSPGLYYQMCGRGFRLAPTKEDCLVLDYGGNVLRHGPVDAITIKERRPGQPRLKECPGCRELVAFFELSCPACGHKWPPPPPPERGFGPRHDASATSAGVLTGQVSRETVDVQETIYRLHRKRDDPTGEAPPTMCVEYRVNLNQSFREWICFEHAAGGFPHRKACEWWRRMSEEPMPRTVREAVALAEAGALAPVLAITVEHKAGERFSNVVDWTVGPKPARRILDEDGCSDRAELELEDLAAWITQRAGSFSLAEVAAEFPGLANHAGGVEGALDELRTLCTRIGPDEWRIERTDCLEALADEIPF
jgi:superfamily II DNA or RNA helicase